MTNAFRRAARLAGPALPTWRRGALSVLALALSLPAQAAGEQEEDLRVLHDPASGTFMAYTDAPNALYHHLMREATRHFDQRDAAVGALRTAADWRERQERVRETLLQVVGPFPERTPLNARVLGTVERDDYRVEKLVLESRPNFYVTAALFVPRAAPRPAPAIVYFSGHNAAAFRNATYQRVILNLVRKGFVVLAIDPVGQGERLQYFDPDIGRSRIGANTLEHSYAGAQLFLTGGSIAREMIWDGIRAIDYLVSRPEVDVQRIGVTGRSGGGTQASYVAAFDPRVRAAAIENYLMSLRRLWETRGPQDAEQNFFHGIARGLDHADLIVARAPLPTLVVATTRDIFNIQGVREMYAEAARAYAAMGAPGALRIVEDDAAHQSTRANREAVYAFFQRSLSLPGSPLDEDVEILPAEALRVTPTGQLATSLGGETPFSLNRAVAARQAEELRRRRVTGAAHLVEAVRSAWRLSGYRDPGSPPAPLFMGRYRRPGSVVEKYLVPGGDRYPIPFLLIRPDTGAEHPAVLYLHPGGKAAQAGAGAEMERLARQGFAVIAPDLVGTGEMGPGDFRGDSHGFRVGSAPYGLWFGSILVGQSFTGVRAADVVRLVRSLGQLPGVEAGEVRAIARGEAAPALLHAAALEPSIAGVALVEPLASYASLADTRYYQTRFATGGVAGMLASYDLPDLAAALAPRPLLVMDAVDAAGEPLPQAGLRQTLAVAEAAYARAGLPEKLDVRRTEGGAATEVLARWLDAGSATHRPEDVSVHADFDRGSLGPMRRIGPNLYRGSTRHWIKADGIGDQYYWFFFRAEGTRGKPLTFVLDRLTGIYRGNTHEVYTSHTRPVFSYDRVSWGRISDVAYDEEAKSFRFSHTFQRDTVWIAYAHPYPWDRAEELVRSLRNSPYATVEQVAHSRERRPVSVVTITDPATADQRKKVVMVQALQHAGEDAGGHLVEGMIKHLLSDDPGARRARQRFIYKIIPAMNPDGLYHGTTRYNLGMQDLNSIWLGSTEEPEVAGVKRWVDGWRAAGWCIDLFIDVHSHSQQIRRNVFLAAPTWGPEITEQMRRRWSVAHGRSNLQGSAVSYLSSRYGVPAATLELTQSDLGEGEYLDVDDYRRFGRETVEGLAGHFEGAPSGACPAATALPAPGGGAD